MRILQINKFLYPKGGTETYALSLIELLKNEGHEVVCFSQKNPKNIPCGEEGYFIDNLDLSGFSLRALAKIPRIFWSFKARRLVKKLIQDKRPDIVHIHNIYHQISPSILPIFRRAGIPVVMTVHDFKLILPSYVLRADGADRPHKNSGLAQLILNLEFAWHKWLDIYGRNIDLFIAPSEFVKDKLAANGFNPAKIRVIPHFLPDSFFSRKKTTAEKSSDKYVFAYGRLDEGKGFDDLIGAFAELNISGMKLKIAGSGPDQARLERMIDENRLGGKIELLGQKTQEEIRSLISAAKIIVNCSRLHESFGLTVLEAMAAGKPVIASKVGAVPELISDGENGLLYHVSDIGDLKIQLSKLAGDADLRKKLSTNAKKAARRYSQKRHLAEIISAYEEARAGFKKPIRFVHESLINLAAFIVLTALLVIPFYHINIEKSSADVTAGLGYPRLANLYWKNPVAMSDAAELAKWDILVLDMQAQTNSADAIREIRRINPNIIILAYTTANEMPTSRLSAVEPSGSGLWHDLASGDQTVWHLRTWRGSDTVFWPGNVMMNLGVKDSNGRTYADYLVDFYDRKVMSTGLWDGLFFDNTWQNVAHISSEIDIDADGRADSADKINRQWQDSFNNFFGRLRSRLGSRAILIGNGDGAYQQYLNGRMFEGFPEYWEGGWTGSIQRYSSVDSGGYKPRINIINSDTGNTGNRYDYQSMRFGLASALLFDGYYSFDYGTNLREQLWWYDEYDADLGAPLGAAKNMLSASSAIVAGVWQRDFANGIVIVNSTDQARTVSFDAEYEKLRGSQDAKTNDGSIINKITIPALDGIILHKRASDLFEGVFTNGAYARIFDSSGNAKRTGFFSYLSQYPGSAAVLRTDIDADGLRETLVADKGALRLYDERGVWQKTAYPYGDKFTGSISLAVARYSGNSSAYIIVSPSAGGANLVRIFDRNLEFSGSQFNAYSRTAAKLGANVASCDINSDGQPEIISGAGFSGGPHVKILSMQGKTLNEFFAYGLNFRGGVSVACGDINGDGKAEIITGAGPTGGPHVRVWNADGGLISQWFAYDPAKRGGVAVGAVDIDGDSKLEIAALNSNIFGK